MNDNPIAGEPELNEDPLSVLYQAHSGMTEVELDEPGTTAGLLSSNAESVGPNSEGPEERIRVELDVVPRVQYAMYANDVPVLRSVRIENQRAESAQNIEVVVRAEPAFAGELVLRLDELRSGAMRRFEAKLVLDPEFLDQLTERVEGRVVVEVRVEGIVVATAVAVTKVLTRSEWPGDGIYPELLAAFVMPNDSAVGDLLRSAGEVLAEWSGSPTIDGYQRNNPETVLRQVAAMYSALAAIRIQYVSPPASFESEGQRVRLPQQIASSKQAACLDLSLYMAAAIEAAGLHPVVVLVEGHAFCGAFLEERTWPDSSTDDGARLRNEVKVADLVVFDPTCAVAGNGFKFEDAKRVAEKHLDDDAKFRVAIDVRRARVGGVRPMASVESRRAAEFAVETIESFTGAGSVPDASAAIAAHARRASSSREVIEGPERIEAWKRKLLDLTLRNRLLNLPAKGKIVRLMVPDVARLEDALAEGARFSVAPRPEEVAEDGLVVGGAIRPKRTEGEMHELLAAGQSTGTLYADLDEDALNKRLTALRRDANSAEQEGGSSNLYLGVGMLKFFESEKSEKARIAPVVLVPVQLVQRTARAGVELSARSEDARINVTLLRFLEEVHTVQIDGVDPPPDDGNGLDIPFIFQRFREEITGKHGWEVLEEARLGMFSFSKILIWRDLDEYSDRLLESPVVQHLVETPREKFSDGVDFRDPAELDKVARSSETYVPMSADSSQLAAILAAAEGKSFVLIGPPGTGKSQTITNLITHCLATGKSVLFVSEKMAALEVVHRRLGQVGLEDKCLELHSGKTDKKKVLSHLELSLNSVEESSPVVRDSIAKDLDEVRSQLNGYVEALHRERPSGESVFRVLSRLIGLGPGVSVELHWSQISHTQKATLDLARTVAVECQASAMEAVVGPSHPLKGIGHLEFSPLWEEQASKALSAAIGALRQFSGTAQVVRIGLLGECSLPVNEDMAPLLEAMALLQGAPLVSAESLVEDNWTDSREAAREAFAVVQQLREERSHFEARYARASSDIDHRELLEELKTVESKWFLPSGVIHPVAALSKTARARRTLARISSTVLRQTNGFGSSLCSSM